MRLLDMLVSKNVSGQGRDQALNLLNKNIPRKDLKDHGVNKQRTQLLAHVSSFCLSEEVCERVVVED